MTLREARGVVVECLREVGRLQQNQMQKQGEKEMEMGKEEVGRTVSGDELSSNRPPNAEIGIQTE